MRRIGFEALRVFVALGIIVGILQTGFLACVWFSESCDHAMARLFVSMGWL